MSPFAFRFVLILIVVHICVNPDAVVYAVQRTGDARQGAPQLGPIQRTDPKSLLAHQQLVDKATQGKVDVYFVGDSITRRWGAIDYPQFLAQWKKRFHGWNAANFGWGGDTTNHILWRMQNGELEGVDPKVFVLQAGTNNLPWDGAADPTKVGEVVQGIQSIMQEFRHRSPQATIILTGVFPRSQNPALTPTIRRINEDLEKLTDGKLVRWVDLTDKVSDANGALLPGMSEDGLHFTEKSYHVWADALTPILHEILGPPSNEDHGPPPTGDPSAGVTSAGVAFAAQLAEPAVATETEPAVTKPAERLTTPGGAEIPDAVRIKRPTTEEMARVEKALAEFIDSADSSTKAILNEYPTLLQVREPRPNTAVVPNLAPFFRQKHQANVEVAKQGESDMLFLGDSITDFWRNPDGPFAGKPVFDQYFGEWNVANFGISGDTTQGVLYRLQHGEGEGFQPRVVMLMIGTNNTPSCTAPEIAEGIGAVVLELQDRFPEAKILLLAVFPRANPNDAVRSQIQEINETIKKLHDGDRVHYMDIGSKFLDAEGRIPTDIMVDALHPSTKGYEIWAKAVKDKLTELRGN